MLRLIVTLGITALLSNFAFASVGTLDFDVRHSPKYTQIVNDFTTRGGWIECGRIVTLGPIQDVTDISSYCSADYNDGAGMVQVLMQGKVRGLNGTAKFDVQELTLFK